MLGNARVRHDFTLGKAVKAFWGPFLGLYRPCADKKVFRFQGCSFAASALCFENWKGFVGCLYDPRFRVQDLDPKLV